jgi:hypothetical protein
MIYAFKVDVTAIGLDEMREYPELGSSPLYARLIDGADTSSCLWYDSPSAAEIWADQTIGWAAVHVSMNILLFLIKLNFR